MGSITGGRVIEVSRPVWCLPAVDELLGGFGRPVSLCLAPLSCRFWSICVLPTVGRYAPPALPGEGLLSERPGDPLAGP